MAFQLFKIKYIPDIFPDLDFTSSVIVDSYYMELPALTTIAKTQERFGTWYDLTKEQRKIQAVRERRIRFEWITKERVEYDNLLLADFLQVETDDNRTLDLFNPTLTVEKINDFNNYKIVLEASIKELDQIATYRGSAISENKGSPNFIDFKVKNPIWQLTKNNITLHYDGSRFFYQVSFDINEIGLLTDGDVYYWHSDNDELENYHEKFQEAQISVSGNIATINLYIDDAIPPNLPIFNFQLDNIIEYQEVTTNITPQEYKIYFDFEPQIQIKLKNNNKISDAEGIEYNSIVQIQKILMIKFYLKENELDLIKNLYQADEITINTATEQYTVLQSPDSIKQVDRNDLIKLYEFNGEFVIQNIKNTQK